MELKDSIFNNFLNYTLNYEEDTTYLGNYTDLRNKFLFKYRYFRNRSI